jgi:primary-amine oxidase
MNYQTGLLATLLLFFSASAYAQKAQHPLDPLTWEEYWFVTKTLHEAGHYDKDTTLTSVNLIEPAKDFVLKWKPGKTIPRSAKAIVRKEEKTFRAIVDLNKNEVAEWTVLEGVQPMWSGSEYGSMGEEIMAHPEVVAALKRRGISDPTFISTVALPLGTFGIAEEEGRRISHVVFVEYRGERIGWHREIEGLVAVVDLNSKKILRVVDEGAVPTPDVSIDYDRGGIGKAREVPSPILVQQPNGPGFKVDGHSIEWQNWRFHVRPDVRLGMIISSVSYQDGDESRNVMYQGNLSEIFVPYMDPSISWYRKNYIDAGEYSADGLTKPLMQNVDCPPHTYFMDAVFADTQGHPFQHNRMIGIFEREPGDPSWRHYKGPEEAGPDGRIKRDLVVRCAAVLANYDYIFDWIFQQDGSIVVKVGATGMVAVKQVAEKSVHDSTNNDPDEYGRMIDERIVGVNHDHYFSFRLDMDVDGTNNSLSIDKLRIKELPEDHPRRSVWTVQSHVAQKESEAMMNINLEKPALWRFTSAKRENKVGHPTSYRIKPGMTGAPLISENDYPRRRAGFINHHLWVTPYEPNEFYAAGEFPTLSTPDMGLPTWTKNDRPIANTDIVAWYTVGMHHVVRSEDWPVMPVAWHSFEIRPFDFFNRNPALDLPK